MVVNTAQGCADTLAASLEVYPLPNVQFSMDPVCEGTPILVEWDEAECRGRDKPTRGRGQVRMLNCKTTRYPLKHQ